MKWEKIWLDFLTKINSFSKIENEFFSGLGVLEFQNGWTRRLRISVMVCFENFQNNF